jgi:hypothetical protein
MNSNIVNDSKISNDYIKSDSSYEQYTNPDSESLISTFMTIIIGILLGAVIGYFIFRDIKYIGPDSNEIVKRIYEDEKGHKYKYRPKITICPMNYSMNKFKNPNFKVLH